MIRNIIFDLGNVLISFNPADYLSNHGYPEDLKNTYLNDVFRSAEWRLIDNGDLTTVEAIDVISSRSSLKRHEISEIFDLRNKILLPIDNNIKILPELKKQGFRLYFLSNFPCDIFEDVVERNSFFKLFDGGIISARVKASKPGKRIYDILMEKYSLIPRECLFIDDLEPNVETAVEMGMTGIWLYDTMDLENLIKEKLNSIH
jgi:epoxide hydrolase-like predicted phosphatase